MTRSIWRTVLLCLLLVALPLQGAAAWAVPACHAHGNWADQGLAVSAALGTAHAMTHAMAHHMANEDGPHVARDETHTPMLTGQDPHQDRAACHASDNAAAHASAAGSGVTVCGPCCIGAVGFMSMPVWADTSLTAPDFPPLFFHYLSADPGRLDRPPRSLRYLVA